MNLGGLEDASKTALANARVVLEQAAEAGVKADHATAVGGDVEILWYGDGRLRAFVICRADGSISMVLGDDAVGYDAERLREFLAS
jgi:hypothetical protein